MIKEILGRTLDTQHQKTKTFSVARALMRLGLSEQISARVACDIVNHRAILSEANWAELDTKVPYEDFRKLVEGVIGAVGSAPDPKAVDAKAVLTIIQQKVEDELRRILYETGGTIDEISDLEIPKTVEGDFKFIYSVSFPVVGLIVPSIIECVYSYEKDTLSWTVAGKDVEFKETSEDLRGLIGKLMEKVSEKVNQSNK